MFWNSASRDLFSSRGQEAIHGQGNLPLLETEVHIPFMNFLSIFK